ncbi:MAG: hypothetical protein M1812_003261 [Candelaria pacifica]|nr:MAG: hypothetical protein M1812_003261 [Candelaria pacifica]
MAPITNEGDIAFNKINVALARSQRQIASWLPPRTAEETANTKSEAEIDKEDAELFQPISELAGLGAPLPKEITDGDANRQELSSNDKLRRQLFGGKIASRMKVGVRPEINGNGAVRHRPVTKPPCAGIANGEDEDDEEDEGGRSSLGRSKRKREKEHTADVDDDRPDITTAQSTSSSGQAHVGQRSQNSKPTSSFLDEILAEKSRKKKKKRKNKNGREGQ